MDAIVKLLGCLEQIRDDTRAMLRIMERDAQRKEQNHGVREARTEVDDESRA
jgi:hypothetical protein